MNTKEIHGLLGPYQVSWLFDISDRTVRRVRAVWSTTDDSTPPYMSVEDKARQIVGYDRRLDWVAQQRGWPPGARRVLQREYTR